MRFYIPIRAKEFILIEGCEPARVVYGEPDPFSRVACPLVRWSMVRGDLPWLDEQSLKRAKRSKIAYTRVYEE